MAREFINQPTAGIEEDEFEVISSFPSSKLASRDVLQQDDEFEVVSSFGPSSRAPIQQFSQEEEVTEEPADQSTLGKISSYLGRQVARGGARVAESVAGLPGDVLKGAGSLVRAGVEKLTGFDVNINKALDKCFSLSVPLQLSIHQYLLNRTLVEKQTGIDGYPNSQFASL